MIQSHDPATGKVIAQFEETDPKKIPELIERARQAQRRWVQLSVKKRCEFLFHIRETLIDRADQIVDVISQENGKPKVEALSNEIVPSADLLGLFANRAPRILKDQSLPLRILKYRKSSLNYWPHGVVLVISPWNYPFLLPFADIIMALVAGNAVLFKPSEETPAVGMQIQELCGEAGLPEDLLQTLIGKGDLGAELVRAKPNKIFFTGSVSTGKKIMGEAAKNLTPVNLELGGKDAMIVLPDADLEYATSAALWGSFSNAGQVCASTERIFIHERMNEPFTQLLKSKIEKLRIGDSKKFKNDVGPITMEKQKDVYEKQLEEAKEKGAQIEVGGTFLEGRRFFSPTIVTGDLENLAVYREETFGPIVSINQYKTLSEAVRKANDSPYGLLASVITGNPKHGLEIAKQLEVGTVTVNEVLYTAGIPETPWGGVKHSGIGRTHSEKGLYEFVQTRHIHEPLFRMGVFKSFWWFPYSNLQFQLFKKYLELHRRSWIRKITAIPDFLSLLVQFIKKEKRL